MNNNLNGHRSQFRLSVENVADGVDVADVGLLALVGHHLAVARVQGHFNLECKIFFLITSFEAKCWQELLQDNS